MVQPRLILVVGLPGSGKSHHCKKLAEEAGITNRDEKDDDFLQELPLPFGLPGVIARLTEGETCIVNDIALCLEWRLAEVKAEIEARVPGASLEWQFFDNDPVQCAVNVLLDSTIGKRGDPDKRIDKIRRYSPVYRPPEKSLPVWGRLPRLDKTEINQDWSFRR